MEHQLLKRNEIVMLLRNGKMVQCPYREPKTILQQSKLSIKEVEQKTQLTFCGSWCALFEYEKNEKAAVNLNCSYTAYYEITKTIEEQPTQEVNTILPLHKK